MIEAFKSTLEEARYADLILHVADVSNPRMDEQMYTVYETLKSLDVMDKPVVTVFNKQDKLSGDAGVIRDLRADYTVKLSAGTKEGIPELLKTIEAVLRERKILIERLYSYQEAGKLQLIRRQGELLEEDYREDGIFVRAYVPAEIYEKTAPIKKDDKPEYPLETL